LACYRVTRQTPRAFTKVSRFFEIGIFDSVTAATGGGRYARFTLRTDSARLYIDELARFLTRKVKKSEKIFRWASGGEFFGQSGHTIRPAWWFGNDRHASEAVASAPRREAGGRSTASLVRGELGSFFPPPASISILESRFGPSEGGIFPQARSGPYSAQSPRGTFRAIRDAPVRKRARSPRCRLPDRATRGAAALRGEFVGNLQLSARRTSFAT
jgi:hypothetical protein